MPIAAIADEGVPVLKMANGEVINLQAAPEGTVALVNGVSVIKEKGKSLHFRPTGRATNTDALAKDSLLVPKCSDYFVRLADGSTVKLNAGTLLVFNAQLAGKERVVKIDGEAYFEVAKSSKPFIIESKLHTVKVLGTHINVCSYPNEPERITLTEGALSVTGKSMKFPKSYVLRPDEQSVGDGKGIYITDVETSHVLAWRTEKFEFSKTPIEDALRQISRWYGVKVDYNGLPDEYLTAGLDKNLTLLQVINIIEGVSNIKLQLNGNTIRALRS